MTKCITSNSVFNKVKNRKIDINFSGGDVTSDGGALLLKEVDNKLGLTKKLSLLFSDARDPDKITHSLEAMVKQRVYGIALGYEDLNDHQALRKCPAIQTTVGKITDLASPSTLCRLENSVDRKFAVEAHKIMVDQFIDSYKSPPKSLILDFDATDDEIHGNQEGKYYHGYYRHYCFLPLYVFCGKKLLVSYLRTSKQDQAKHSWAILTLLTKRMREAWPDVEIIFRGDGGFCRHRMFNWCERNNVKYIVGLAKNKKLKRLLQPTMDEAKELFTANQEKQRKFTEFQYAAKSWSKERRVIGKAEVMKHGENPGENPRFIVTNLEGSPQALYDDNYCARGDMENRIKEQQLDLFSDRTSCKKWWPNQLRLILSSLSYCLIEYIRSNLLQGTELAKAQIGSIRLKLFKIGGVIIRNTRKIKFLLSSSYPYQKLWDCVLRNMVLL